MELEGTYHDGVIVPDDTTTMSEGMRVRIEPVTKSDATAPQVPLIPFSVRYAEFKGCLPADTPADLSTRKSFLESYGDLIGEFPDLPTDLAAQHDHYRLGTPKR